ncbi:FAD/NAD(P)-binding domain-containing protein [Exidia glandulosa HHB12029]|uniref:FAD/NAD(P)-binding domain-containing protein n=1 Tax=Exidia glandulosa HHB12029 TaxID=1314781 RepID=A0A165HF02_EXIGL|nr:FAD/NAD(P)-binding domain-containing protein [Exidia glandulosa HHB12029]
MPSDHVKLIYKALGFFVPYLGRLAVQRVAATYHSWTWRDTPDARNVVVVGGSFAGLELVRRLAETLPTGWRVVWVEKNSHLNYSFNFPRFSVMTGHEHEAFIPYDGVARGAPKGIFRRVQDTAVTVTEKQVVLASGEQIDYDFLVIATGSSQPLPVQVVATERDEACHELQGVQSAIRDSQRIAVVGGGAVGVELAGDIKDFYPDKDVTLVHSRDRLMSYFGKRLGQYALVALRDELGIRVLLNERPSMPVQGNMARSASLTFSDGREETFDLIIGCTGQRPNSSLLADLLPVAVSKENARILVRPTLQVQVAEAAADDMRIFALGDVAEHGGPRMARAGWMQSNVVLDNILSMIRGSAPTHTYTPHVFIEGAIKLTLGKTHNVVYAMESDGSDIMVPTRNNRLDLGIKRAWRAYGVQDQFKQFE